MNEEVFTTYIREVINPEIEPRTVVICDNLATHKNKTAAKALHRHGCWFLFPPPDSPDVNPSERAFSKLKAHLRKRGARSHNTVFQAIGETCELLSAKECQNDFTASGY